jgi:hypothetical protein
MDWLRAASGPELIAQKKNITHAIYLDYDSEDLIDADTYALAKAFLAE